MTIRGIITVLVLAILFGLVVVWISKQGGWKGEGCGGNCASCHHHDDCEQPMHQKPPAATGCPGVLCYSCPLWAA